MPTPAERKALSVAMQALGRQLVAEGIVGSNFWQCQRAGAAAINSSLTAPLSSGKIDTLAAKMVKTLLPELPGMLSTLFQFASPPVTAVGPLGTVELPGGATAFEDGGASPYVGDGMADRVIDPLNFPRIVIVNKYTEPGGVYVGTFWTVQRTDLVGVRTYNLAIGGTTLIDDNQEMVNFTLPGFSVNIGGANAFMNAVGFRYVWQAYGVV